MRTMDPVSAVGLASSAAQLAEYAGIFFLKLYRYYVDVRGAPVSASKLRDQVGLSLSLINALYQIIITPDSVLSSTNYAAQLKEAFDSVRLLLKEFDKRVEPENAKGIRALLWPFGEKEINRMISELQQKNNIFQLAVDIVLRLVVVCTSLME